MMLASDDHCMNIKSFSSSFVRLCVVVPLYASFSHAADVRVSGGTVTGGSAQGGSASGGSVTGGSATGGSVTGGSATGGSATGGSVSGGTVTTAGSAQSGTATAGSVGAGTATAYAEGREIRVTAAGSVSVSANGPAANIDIAGQTLTVAKTELLLHGRTLAQYPSDTKKIEVHLDAQDMLSVKGDGKEVTRVKMPRK